jgi:hypothetical protein
MLTGLGGGKTHTLALGVYLDSLVYPEMSVAFGAPSYKMLRNGAIKTFHRRHAEWGFDFKHIVNRQVVEFTTYLECGKPYRTYAEAQSLHDPDNLRGNNLAVFHMDEPAKCKKAAHHQILARLRWPGVQNKYRVYGTPKGFNWVYDYFVGDFADNAENPEVTKALHRDRGAILGVSTAANFFNPASYVETLKTSYSESQFQQEALGAFVALGEGRIYHCFDRARNISREAEYRPGQPIIMGWDFNVMGSVTLSHVDDYGIQTFDEIQMPQSHTAEVCQEILSRYWHGKLPDGRRLAPADRCRQWMITGDATGTRHGTRSRKHDYDIINDHFENPPANYGSWQQEANTIQQWAPPKKFLRESNPSRSDRYGKVNAALKNAKGEVRLMVHPRCVRLIRDFEQVVYKAGSTDVEKDSEGVLTHLSDGEGYKVYAMWPGKDLSSKPRAA